MISPFTQAKNPDGAVLVERMRPLFRQRGSGFGHHTTGGIEMELSGRARSMLRAVAAGRAEVTGGTEPELYVDGLPCCDQMATHDLVHAGLLRPTRPTSFGRRV